MNSYRYVRLDPTGNRTCLVLDPVPEMERKRVTAALMNRCEQVGYLLPAERPENRARLRMMGGEFCGNASMATAAYLCRLEGAAPGSERDVLLEVSGTDGPVRCRIRAPREGDEAWKGTVWMPPVLDVRPLTFEGEEWTAVQLEGILHLIREKGVLDRKSAEEKLLRFARQCGAPAVGLLQWDAGTGRMIPLVHVPGEGTLVWETACGSGSTAVGALAALRAGEGETVSPILQPGGVIRASVRVRNGKVTEVRISGRISIGPEEILRLDPGKED